MRFLHIGVVALLSIYGTGVLAADGVGQPWSVAAYKQVSASVVMIISRSYDGQTGAEYVTAGSGFAIDRTHIVTDYHVIGEATRISIVTQSEKAYSATIVGTAPNFDIALLQLTDGAPAMEAAQVGSANNLQLGQDILAIGSPFGTQISVTSGIISGLKRELSDNLVERELIQFDAAINPGQSGGPLVDSDGQVIGVIIAKAQDGESIGFATPINRVVEVVPDLIRMGHPFRAEIGVRGADIDEEIASLFGLDVMAGFLVEGVEPGSAAAKAGLVNGSRVVELRNHVYVLGGDIIMAANNIPVASGRDLGRVLGSVRVDDMVDLLVVRNGSRRIVSIKIPAMSHWPGLDPSAVGGN